jgi:DNA-binding MarR family transcriptional regulator
MNRESLLAQTPLLAATRFYHPGEEPHRDPGAEDRAQKSSRARALGRHTDTALLRGAFALTSKDERTGEQNVFQAVDRFTYEVALLFFRMRAVATEYIGQGQHSTGRRSILLSVSQRPQTVPEMARERGVSRQHVQKLVDHLVADRLVMTRVNPADRRSRLVSPTSMGNAYFRALRARETKLFSHLARGLDPKDFRRATALIKELRSRLENQPGGSRTRKRPPPPTRACPLFFRSSFSVEGGWYSWLIPPRSCPSPLGRLDRPPAARTRRQTRGRDPDHRRPGASGSLRD